MSRQTDIGWLAGAKLISSPYIYLRGRPHRIAIMHLGALRSRRQRILMLEEGNTALAHPAQPAGRTRLRATGLFRAQDRRSAPDTVLDTDRWRSVEWKRRIAETHGETVPSECANDNSATAIGSSLSPRAVYVQVTCAKIYVPDAEKIAQHVKSHSESVRVLDVQQGNLAFKAKFQIRPGGNPVSPIHAIAHARAPVMTAFRACPTLLKAQRVDRKSAPAPFQKSPPFGVCLETRGNSAIAVADLLQRARKFNFESEDDGLPGHAVVGGYAVKTTRQVNS